MASDPRLKGALNRRKPNTNEIGLALSGLPFVMAHVFLFCFCFGSGLLFGFCLCDSGFVWARCPVSAILVLVVLWPLCFGFVLLLGIRSLRS